MGKASFPEFCILSISFRRSQGGKKTMFASRNVKRIFNSLFSLQHKPDESSVAVSSFYLTFVCWILHHFLSLYIEQLLCCY